VSHGRSSDERKKEMDGLWKKENLSIMPTMKAQEAIQKLRICIK